MSPAEEQKEAKDAIDVLSLEFTALRAEIDHHSAARNSMLSVALGVLALWAAPADKSGQISLPFALGVMALYLVAVGTVWVRLGRSIGQVSNHLVELEEQINDLSGVPDPLLTWETRAAQRRTFYRRVFIGKPPDPKRHSTRRGLIRIRVDDRG